MTRHQMLARDMMLEQFDPVTFTHEDHIGAAFELLKQCEFLEATSIYARAIKKLATSAGAPEKFNTTITLAFLSIIAERSRTGQTLAQFMADNSDLLAGDLLAAWYDNETLDSESARNAFVMPPILESRQKRSTCQA